jgi:hypothetical protein
MSDLVIESGGNVGLSILSPSHKVHVLNRSDFIDYNPMSIELANLYAKYSRILAENMIYDSNSPLFGNAGLDDIFLWGTIYFFIEDGTLYQLDGRTTNNCLARLGDMLAEGKSIIESIKLIKEWNEL